MGKNTCFVMVGWLFIFFAFAGGTGRGWCSELTAGTTTVGSNVYPPEVLDLRRAATLQLPLDIRCAAIDSAGDAMYLASYTMPGRAFKVRLSDFTLVATLTLGTGGDQIRSAAIDPAGGYVYFGAWSYPGRIYRVRLADFSLNATLELPIGEDILSSAVIDPAGGYLYFGTALPPAKVVKIRLSDFTRVDSVSLPTVSGGFKCAAIDPPAGFAYFGTDTTPGKVFKIRLSDLSPAGELALNPDEKDLYGAEIDPAGGFAYFIPLITPGKVIRIRLSDFTRQDSLTFASGARSTGSMVIDRAGGCAYLGIDTNPGSVVKVRLADFKESGAFRLRSGEYVSGQAAVIDPASGTICFRTSNSPQNLIKISLHGASFQNMLRATRITLPESAGITSFRIYSHQAGGNLRLALYDNNATTRTLLWQSAAIANTTRGNWINIPVAAGSVAPLCLRAGDYCLAFNSDTTQPFASYAPGHDGDGFRCSQAFGVFPPVLAASAVSPAPDLWSQYLTYEPVFINTPPVLSGVAITPSTPGTLDDIAAVLTITDPDPGDTITAYHYEWWQGGVLKSTSSTLAAALTTRDQVWTLRAMVKDSYGEWSQPGQATFTIADTPPSPPVVAIRPKPARDGEDLICNFQKGGYSTDPDGDPIGYDYNWFRSDDGGLTWEHRMELDGQLLVDGAFIFDGMLWEVRCIPYEKTTATAARPKGTGSPDRAGRVEGQYGWDRAYIGANNPPELTLESPLAQRQAGGTLLSVGWNFNDADLDACTVDLDWLSASQPAYTPLARNLPARQGTCRSLIADAPQGAAFKIHGVIRDARGAIAQQISEVAVTLPPAPALVANYLLGKSTSLAALDINGDQMINVADLVHSIQASLPELPANPTPADAAKTISWTPTLDWSDCPHAKLYQLYLWQGGKPRPAAPTASNLATSTYSVRTSLLKNTVYWWQVITVNGSAKVSGPVWAFTTKP